MTHFLASVLISYSSPAVTAFDAFTESPCSFTRPFSHASLARLRVLNTLIAHRYLSIRNFSFCSAMVMYLRRLFLCRSKLTVFVKRGIMPPKVLLLKRSVASKGPQSELRVTKKNPGTCCTGRTF